jgi:hypothetical protein
MGFDMKLTLYTLHEQKNILLIYLGESDGYVIGLDSQQVPTAEKLLIREFMKFNSDPKAVMLFVKKRCPTSYSKAYRKIKSANLKLVKTYEI